MPRFITRPATPSPQQEKLVQLLVKEFSNGGKNLQPLILEEEIAATKSRHVRVIWNRWTDLDFEQRSRVIEEAYRQVEGAEAAANITLAEGCTPREALALGLLPYKVVLRQHRKAAHELVSSKEMGAAKAHEARHTLLGSKSKELRYARIEDAEGARERLQRALPGSLWTVAEEVATET